MNLFKCFCPKSEEKHTWDSAKSQLILALGEEIKDATVYELLGPSIGQVFNGLPSSDKRKMDDDNLTEKGNRRVTLGCEKCVL